MHRLRFLMLCAAAATGFGAVSGTLDLDGKAVDAFAPAAKVRVFVFVRTDCPMANPTRHDLEDAIAAALDGRPQPEASAHAVGCYLADVE